MNLTLINTFKVIPSALTLVSLTACSEIINCDEFFERGMSVSHVYENAVRRGFSGSTLVRYKGDLLLNEAAGFADRELEIPNSTDTIFTMGSITKQYTGALILSLQEADLLSVDDSLADHFDDVPLNKADITIHQMLTHTAGFPAALGADIQPINRDEYLELAWSTPLKLEPGTGFSYSNTGYSIVAAVAEKVTGKSYEVMINEGLFIPASIFDTGYIIPNWSNRVLAKGYNGSRTIDAIRLPWSEDGPYWNLHGNGGLLTTTTDLLKWHDALAGESVLSASSVEALQRPHAVKNSSGVGYGYGWNIVDTPVGDLYWHNGSNGHHYATMSRFTNNDLIVVMLSNEKNKASVCLPTSLARASSPELVNWTGPL